MVVGADGVNSAVRGLAPEHFRPRARVLSNRYVWYGTTRLFDCLTLTFRRAREGAFVAHHYRHGEAASTFKINLPAVTQVKPLAKS